MGWVPYDDTGASGGAIPLPVPGSRKTLVKPVFAAMTHFFSH
jgi:hypothetical protein